MFSEYLRVLGRIKQGHLYSKSSLSRPVLQSVYLCGKENQRKEWKSLDSYACVNPVKMLMALRCISPALAGGWRKWVCPRIPHTWQNLTSAVTTIWGKPWPRVQRKEELFLNFASGCVTQGTRFMKDGAGSQRAEIGKSTFQVEEAQSSREGNGERGWCPQESQSSSSSLVDLVFSPWVWGQSKTKILYFLSVFSYCAVQVWKLAQAWICKEVRMFCLEFKGAFLSVIAYSNNLGI